ncbi:anti-sigma factor [Streptomyces sp. V4-01]|uniref:Regulator of SigK n=1 Tax=Actinacidiphila polyblastidii TaxID=3110430 RepID=A0ABU7PCK0_9ACTN|nr:anti-sigma factor [Streptomyces sp. V4-01]
MSEAGVHTAAGAYVVHALSDRDRELFERHMEHCEPCRREVAEMEATTAELGVAAAVAAAPPDPAAAKSEVLRRIASTRQQRPPRVRQPVRWFPRRSARLVPAAALAAAATFGGLAAWQHQEALAARSGQHAAQHQAASRQAAIADVLSAPDTKLSAQRLSDGAVATVAASRSRDAAVFIADGLRTLPKGHEYQIWFTGSGGPRSAGLLPGNDTQQLSLLNGPVAGAKDVAVTIEPAGGSQQPTPPLLATIRLPS